MSFVCVEVLQLSQPNGVMSSAVSLPNHTFTGRLSPLSGYLVLCTFFHQKLTTVSGERMCTILGNNQREGENDHRKYFMINLYERMFPRGLNPRTPGLQSNSASNWATKASLGHGAYCQIIGTISPVLLAWNLSPWQGNCWRRHQALSQWQTVA